MMVGAADMGMICGGDYSNGLVVVLSTLGIMAGRDVRHAIPFALRSDYLILLAPELLCFFG
jgi:hypothetical protein